MPNLIHLTLNSLVKQSWGEYLEYDLSSFETTLKKNTLVLLMCSLHNIKLNCFFFFALIYLFFKWRIVALQGCVGFCQQQCKSAISTHVAHPVEPFSIPHPILPL